MLKYQVNQRSYRSALMVKLMMAACDESLKNDRCGTGLHQRNPITLISSIMFISQILFQK